MPSVFVLGNITQIFRGEWVTVKLFSSNTKEIIWNAKSSMIRIEMQQLPNIYKLLSNEMKSKIQLLSKISFQNDQLIVFQFGSQSSQSCDLKTRQF